tara:strand:+ start:748 stop:939 length:192 start_codon:yes stop_codon:yes gene_type:complete
MTDKVNLYIYRINNGSKRIKKIKLSKFIQGVNHELFTKKFFVNRKEAEEDIKKNARFQTSKIL